MRTAIEPTWVLSPEGLRSGVRVLVEDKLIVGVERADRHPDPGVPVRRMAHTLLMPGLVNAHSHAFQRAFRGHVQWRAGARDDFWSWREAMYRAANALTPDGIEAVSRLAFLEMVEAGITHVGEFHYLHHQTDGTRYDDPDELARRVIAAARSVGLRITLLRVVYGRSGAGLPANPLQQRFLDRDADDALAAASRLAKLDDPLVNVGLAPHSVRAVPPAWLRALADFAGPVHAHVSEQEAENAACLAEVGLSPLQHLANSGLVHERFTAVHLTRPVEGDLALARTARAMVCACPTTELDLGDGLLPLDARLTLPICLGSDSQAAIDPWWEARTLELHGRAQARARNVLAPMDERHGLARRLLTEPNAVGRRSLGVAPVAIEAGAPADLIAIRLDAPSAAGVPPLEAAAFAAHPNWVSDVWVAGREVVGDGRHADRDAIARAALHYITSATA